MKTASIIDLIHKWNFAFRIFGRNLSIDDYKKILKFIFCRHILHKFSPFSVVFAVTYKCQCNCVHCSIGAYDNSRAELTSQEIKQTLEDISKLGIFKVTFFGGEPLLRKDILELIKFGNQMKLRISIDTNGLNLTKSIAKELKKLRISNVNVSIDSASPNMHDKLRGISGCFEAAVSGIKYCIEEKIPCLVSTYASKRAVENGDLKEIIGLARLIGASGVKILFPILSGKWINKMDEKLSPKEEAEVISLLEPDFVYIEDAYLTVKNMNIKCSALDKNFFYISPSGEVQLCPAIPISFGNVKDKNLNIILNKMWNHNIFKSDCKGCLMNNKVFRDSYPLLLEEKGLPLDVSKL